jgi:hypothetical protein
MARITYTLELELEIRADVSRYIPAKTCGPPENCYPAEGGEVDITSIKLLNPDMNDRSYLRQSLEKLIQELIEDNIKLREPIEEELFTASKAARMCIDDTVDREIADSFRRVGALAVADLIARTHGDEK